MTLKDLRKHALRLPILCVSIVHFYRSGQFQPVSATLYMSRGAPNHSCAFRHFHWLPKYLDMNSIEETSDALPRSVYRRCLSLALLWISIFPFGIHGVYCLHDTSNISRIHARMCFCTSALSWVPKTVFGRFTIFCVSSA